MSFDTLGILFNSPARVKIMRLFLLNSEVVMTSSVVSTRTGTSSGAIRKELTLLTKADFIKRKKTKNGKKTVDGFILNQDFEYISTLENLLFGTEFIGLDELSKRFKRAGKIKLLLLSGVFRRDPSSRLDLLIVGDNLKRTMIDRIIRSLEAEIGKELAYAVFETPEFIYRASMYDKLIRDVIDFPHTKVIHMGGLLEQVPQVH